MAICHLSFWFLLSEPLHITHSLLSLQPHHALLLSAPWVPCDWALQLLFPGPKLQGPLGLLLWPAALAKLLDTDLSLYSDYASGSPRLLWGSDHLTPHS